MSRHRFGIVGLLSVIGACHSTHDTLHTRAAYDLSCSMPATSVANIGGNNWVAQGCNGEAHYTCMSAEDCIRTDPPGVAPPGPQYTEVAPAVSVPARSEPARADFEVPPYGGLCMGLEPGLWDVRVDEGIGPISLGMTRRAVESLGLLERPGAPSNSADTRYFGPLYVVFKNDRVSSVQYHVGCDGGGARFTDGSIVYKGTDFRPFKKGLGSCTTTGEVGEGGAGATWDCGDARRTHVDLGGGCARASRDGTCKDWRGKRDMIRIAIATKW